MSKRGQAWLLVAVAAAAIAGGFLLHSANREPAAVPVRPEAGSALLQASLPDLAGRPQRLDQWRGKVVVVNFWATWCVPCREEIPELIRVQDQFAAKGVQVVGIAIDQPDKVRPYAAEMRINYPVLVGELDAMELVQGAGNEVGGLPFTVVLDRSGKAAGSVLGRVTTDKLHALVLPLL